MMNLMLRRSGVYQKLTPQSEGAEPW